MCVLQRKTSTLPKTNIAPSRRPGPKRKLIFQAQFFCFSGAKKVTFREGGNLDALDIETQVPAPASSFDLSPETPLENYTHLLVYLRLRLNMYAG